MKLFYSVFSILLISSAVSGQPVWDQKLDLQSTTRYASYSFVAGGKAYIGGGRDSNNTYQNDLWQYDPVNNTWTQKANYGGAGRVYQSAFGINDKGYVFWGSASSYAAPPLNETQEVWEYNSTNNTWAQKGNLIAPKRIRASAFSIGGKGYAGLGTDQPGTAKIDFYEYDPANDTWTAKANFTGGSRHGAFSFVIGTRGYIGGGVGYSDFYEYNPASNQWTKKADFGGGARHFAVAFSIGTLGYAGTGFNGSAAVKDFWEYNSVTNQWTQSTDLGGDARQNAVAFALGPFGFVATGSQFADGGTLNKDLWRLSNGKGLLRTLPVVGNFCPGAAFNVGYESDGATFNSGNTFTVELSDNQGSFASPVNIGSTGSTAASGTIAVTLPNNVVDSKAYRVRVTASNVALTGTDALLSVSIPVPSVSIAIPQGSSFCADYAGAFVFNATPVNGGASPTYQWKKNGTDVGTGGPSLSISGLDNGDVITVVMTSNLPCPSSATATSNAITMTKLANITASVTITANPGPRVEAGQTVQFKAVGINAGASPVFQWLKNNNAISSGAPDNVSVPGLLSGDVITCKMTSNASCPTPAVSTSNAITMDVVSATAKDVWVMKPKFPVSDFPAAITDPVFVIDNKAYVINFVANQFYSYDPATEVWTQKANYPNPTAFSYQLRGKSGMAINGKGYVVLGENLGIETRDLYEYDPLANTWTKKADFPGTTRSSAGSFVIGNNGYIVGGSHAEAPGGPYTPLKDVWMYDQVNNTWLQKNDFAGAARSAALAFAIGSKGYVGPAAGVSDFFQYDPANDTWLKKFIPSDLYGSDVPVFVIGNKAYAGLRSNTDVAPIQARIMSFDATSETWSRIADYGGGPFVSMTAFAAAGRGYMTLGGSGPNQPLRDLWRYTPVGGLYTTVANNAVCAGSTFNVNFSSDNVVFGGGNIMTAQLSDKDGKFTNPVSIGTASSTSASGSVSVTIPADVIPSDDYRIRIVASNADQPGGTLTSNGTMPLAIGNAQASTVSISIPGGTEVCTDTPAIFTAVSTTEEVKATYQWKKNGASVGTDSDTYTDPALKTGDVVQVTLTSNSACRAHTPVNSNGITVKVDTRNGSFVLLNPLSQAKVCEGKQLTFTTNLTLPGLNPKLQWYVNDVAVTGATNTSFTSVFADNDKVKCNLVSDAYCSILKDVTSAATTVKVEKAAVPTITKAGNTLTAASANAVSSYAWSLNGAVVAGATASTFTPAASGQVTVQVTESNTCQATSAPFAFVITGLKETSEQQDVYPNPFVNSFIFEVGEDLLPTVCGYKVLNSAGQEVRTSDRVQRVNTVDMTEEADGLYILVLKGNSGLKSVRLLKGP